MFKCQVEFCPYFYIQAKVCPCSCSGCSHLLARSQVTGNRQDGSDRAPVPHTQQHARLVLIGLCSSVRNKKKPPWVTLQLVESSGSIREGHPASALLQSAGRNLHMCQSPHGASTRSQHYCIGSVQLRPEPEPSCAWLALRRFSISWHCT